MGSPRISGFWAIPSTDNPLIPFGLLRANRPPDCFLVLLTTVVGLSVAFAGGLRRPGHGGIKPDRQRAAALERFVIRGPVPGLAGGGVGLLMPSSYNAGFTR